MATATDWIGYYRCHQTTDLIEATKRLREAVAWGHATDAETCFLVLEAEQARRSETHTREAAEFEDTARGMSRRALRQTIATLEQGPTIDALKPLYALALGVARDVLDLRELERIAALGPANGHMFD